MSSDLAFVASLASIQTNLYRYGGPILMTVGTIGCIASLVVFLQKNLRKNPCSAYFIAYNVSNLLLIYTSLLSTTLSTGYFIDPSLYNLIFCRCRFYAMMLFDVLSPSYLILASVDRILVTSSSAVRRRRSNARLAHVCITTITLFWLICHTHALVFTNMVQIAPGYSICYFQLGAYMAVLSYYSLLLKGILVPLLMVVLGIWTVKNVRGAIRTAPTLAATSITLHAGARTVRAKDRQLILMLLMDTCMYVIFSIMVSVVLVYQEFTKNQPQTYVQAGLQNFLFIVGIFSTYIPYCAGCYTNMLISKTFRHEVQKLFMCK